MTNRKWLIIWLIFTAAFLIRALVVINSSTQPAAYMPDASLFSELGLKLANAEKPLSLIASKAFPVNACPVYPIFLGILFKIFGNNLIYIKLAQCFLGALTCIIIYFIAKELFDKKIALIALLLSGFYPVFIKLSDLLFTEGLFVLVLSIAVLFLIRNLKSSSLQGLFYSGISFGFAALTRQTGLGLLLFLLPAIFYFRSKKFTFNKNLKGIFVLIAAFFLVIVPWLARTYLVSGAVLPVSDDGGRVLYSSYAPLKGKIFGVVPQDDVVREAEAIESAGERNAYFVRKTIELIRRDPGRLWKLEALKVAYLWSPFDWEVLKNGLATYNWFYSSFMVFSLYGLFLIFKRGKAEPSFYILILPLLYFQFVYLVFQGSPRYRIPMEPFLIILAGLGIANFYKRWSRKIVPTVIISTVFLVNFMCFLNTDSVKVYIRTILQNAGIW